MFLSTKIYFVLIKKKRKKKLGKESSQHQCSPSTYSYLLSFSLSKKLGKTQVNVIPPVNFRALSSISVPKPIYS